MNNIGIENKTIKLCFINNIFEYLKSNNVNITPEDISIYSGLIGFFWNKDVHKTEIIHGRRASFNGLFSQLMNCVNFETVNYNRIEDLLKVAYFDNNPEALIWVNNNYLSNSIYFNNSDYSSLVVLKHIDSKNVIYFDNGIKKAKFNDFKRLILSHGKCQLIKLNPSSVWKKNKTDSINDGLKKIVVSFQETHEDTSWGHDGLHAFFNSFKAEKNEENFFNIYYALNRPGGLYLTRTIICKFFESNQMLFPLQNYEKCIEIYTHLAKEWHIFANNVFKLSKSYDYLLHKRLISKLSNIVIKEIEGINNIKLLIKTK